MKDVMLVKTMVYNGTIILLAEKRTQRRIDIVAELAIDPVKTFFR